MKARILSHRNVTSLQAQIDEFTGTALTVRHVGYAIDAKGVHFALVLYTLGADRRADVEPAAAKFIADALDAGQTPAA